MATHKVICSKPACGWTATRAARTGKCMRCGSAILWAHGKKALSDPYQTCALASELATFKDDQIKAKLRAAAKRAARSPTPASGTRFQAARAMVDRYDDAPRQPAWPGGRVPMEMRIMTLDTGKIEIIRCPPKRKVKLSPRARRRAAKLKQAYLHRF